MEEDVKVEGETTTEETSTEEKVEEQKVPYSRFKEVYDKSKKVDELSAENQRLKEKKDDTGLSEEEQKELKAELYLKNLTKKVLKEEREETERQKAQEDRKFVEEVDDMVALNPEVKRTEFVKFLEEEVDELGITSVSGAMKAFKKLNSIKKEVAEETKEKINEKPGLPKSSTSQSQVDYTKEDKNKSLAQIAQEAKKSLIK